MTSPRITDQIYDTSIAALRIAAVPFTGDAPRHPDLPYSPSTKRTSVRRWVQQAEIDAGMRSGLTRQDGLVGGRPRGFRGTTISDPMASADDLVKRDLRPVALDHL